MRQQIDGAAVNGFLRDDMLSFRCKSLNRVGNRRRPGRNRKPRNAPFQGRNAVFKNALRGVRQASVDIPGGGETEARRGVFGVMEHIRRRSVNRHGAGIAGGVGRFLSRVDLERFKTIVRHNLIPLSLFDFSRIYDGIE